MSVPLIAVRRPLVCDVVVVGLLLVVQYQVLDVVGVLVRSLRVTVVVLLSH